MIYGHDGTIHKTRYLDVEVDDDGRVVAVWFRCLMLPFKQVTGDGRLKWRGADQLPDILAIHVQFEKEERDVTGAK
jgi:hypothetical protein